MAARKKTLKPAATLVKKRTFIVPLLLVAIVIIAAVGIFFWTKDSKNSGPVLVTVNGEPIYQDEVDQEYNQLPPEYQAQYNKEFILNQTIDKRLLLQEAKHRGLSIVDADVDTQVDSIISQFGLTKENLEKLLAQKNMTLASYKDSVREEMLLSKVIEDAITSHVQVSEQDLVKYYDDHQDEFTAPAGGVIVSHILVENESTAQDIIKQLNAGESFDSLAQQYSTDTGSASQGGYIGIVTNDSTYVPEFEAAALKLRQQQYTKTAVKSTYGYHIIKRMADIEPYKQVRSRIEKQLNIQQQMMLFQAFLADLRAKAVIKFYTSQGIVTETPTKGSLSGFAQCVSGKATLYGTGWSDFSDEQRTMFGDSFSYLNYVDCDEKPHICSAANVQKYPTWVIGNEQFGKLTLADLAQKTGCELPSN